MEHPVWTALAVAGVVAVTACRPTPDGGRPLGVVVFNGTDAAREVAVLVDDFPVPRFSATVGVATGRPTVVASAEIALTPGLHRLVVRDETAGRTYERRTPTPRWRVLYIGIEADSLSVTVSDTAYMLARLRPNDALQLARQ